MEETDPPTLYELKERMCEELIKKLDVDNVFIISGHFGTNVFDLGINYKENPNSDYKLAFIKVNAKTGEIIEKRYL